MHHGHNFTRSPRHCVLYRRHHLDRKNAGGASTALVLKRPLSHGVRVNGSKCRLLQSNVSFLGHRIDAEGIHPLEEKLAAIIQAPAPQNVQELRSFLGLVNYYGKFIPNAATILVPFKQAALQGRQVEIV